MTSPLHTLRRTTIVATLGPASSSRDMIRRLVLAGMDVVRLNGSHGAYADHIVTIANIRSVGKELGIPITILLDLQGPKVRVGKLPGGSIELVKGSTIELIPEATWKGAAGTIPIDYAHAAADSTPGMQVLLADGLFALEVLSTRDDALICRVVEGGSLGSRKGVNFPGLDLRMPCLTDKDLEDLAFGLDQGVDWISLSFVRCAQDLRELKALIAKHGSRTPVVAKIEKPQALDRLDSILDQADCIMVARGDLGVELPPERVPMIQKHIIQSCNRKGIPVITATQMLESMIKDPRPTRAEASDVANAILDGSDAIMLSGETAMGANPVAAVEMMVRIASEVEPRLPSQGISGPDQCEVAALAAAVKVISKTVPLCCIVLFTNDGSIARIVAGARPAAPLIAFTDNIETYHALSLPSGIRPMLVESLPKGTNALLALAETTLQDKGFALAGDRFLALGSSMPDDPSCIDQISLHTMPGVIE